MDHLFNSVVRVEELRFTQVNGRAQMDWVQATDEDETLNWMLGYLPCRLDMSFLRPGKDIAPAPEAGKAPDRIGVMFCNADVPLKAGQRIVAIPNEENQIPVSGTFEIRVIPDLAIDFSSAHHIEVQILETNQALTTENWPEEEALPEEPI